MIDREDRADGYTPPAALPHPVRELAPEIPFLAITLGLLAAAGLGFALFVASWFIYVYIFYNGVIGAGVGAAIARGLGESKDRRGPLLFTIVATCSAAAYLIYNLIWFGLFSLSGQGAGVGSFLQWRAEGELEIGLYGNAAVWVVEYLITLAVAWNRVSVKMRLLDAAAVPDEVKALVVHYLGQEADQEDVREQLAVRGWARREDQDRVFGAVASLASLAQEAEQAA